MEMFHPADLSPDKAAKFGSDSRDRMRRMKWSLDVVDKPNVDLSKIKAITFPSLESQHFTGEEFKARALFL